MEKKIIGLYDGGRYNVKFDEKADCMGGSETWLCEIAKSFVSLGYTVYMFVNASDHIWYKDVHIINKDKMKDVCKKTKFEHFIWSRGIKNFDYVDSEKTGVILHDLTLTDFGENKNLVYLDNIFVLSEFSKGLFLRTYDKRLKNRVKITFNGVHKEHYENKNIQKEKSMVWSSCWHRGLIFFATKVLPRILKEVPDFKLKVCSYCRNHKFDKYIKNPAIIDMGRLGKIELANEQLKASIWCYPNLGYTDFGDGIHTEFMETFCITAVENGLADNTIIVSDKGGFATTCAGIDFVSDKFYRNDRIQNEDLYAQYLAGICIGALQGTYKNKFDAKKYTWLNAAKSLIE
jgi:hypothetical protein